MTDQTLQDARNYETAYAANIRPEERPVFHLSARTGWMNDPNGFSWYLGQYHMFYQYHPYDSHWGPMHWGHAVSRDLLHWEYLPAALAPDASYDRDGCFSGSAIEMTDGRHLLMYTGVVKERQENGELREVQTQCLAIGDGMDYEKYEHNPVLEGKDLPAGCSRSDFRDPKIWQKADGSYCCIVGNRPADGSGQILLFTSPDGFRWNYKKVLCANNRRFGLMWECPDFFALDGKQVLLTSPQDMMPQDFEYHNGNGTLCLIGTYDDKTDTFTEEHSQSVDYGIDFYAPQTVLSPDGRRIMTGWMQNWDTCTLRTVKHSLWYGQMSLPRELHVKNGRLYQQPVRELELMRSGKTAYRNVYITGSMQLEGIRGRTVDLELRIRPAGGERLYRKFAVWFAQNEQYHTSLSFHPEEFILKIDRKFSGSRRAVIHQRRSLVNHTDGCLRLRLILDRYSVEVFVNDGEQVITATFYTQQDADGISFFADGAVCMDIVKYTLN